MKLKEKIAKTENIALITPGSKPESGKGKTFSKICKPIGSIVGSIFFSWCGGNFWGGAAGEDIGGKLDDTINLFS